jgi:hypothetical protein
MSVRDFSAAIASATAAKQAGNAHFAASRNDECVKAYTAAVATLDAALSADAVAAAAPGAPAEELVEGATLLATMNTNLANVLLVMKRFADAAAAAEAAVAVSTRFALPAATREKPHFRLATALQKQGLSFPALIVALEHLHGVAGTDELAAGVAAGVGLTKLSPAFGVAPSHGGYTAVARQAVDVGATLFVESQLKADLRSEPEGGASLDTVQLTCFFAEQIYALMSAKGGRAKKSPFTQLNAAFGGCWPRSDADIPAGTRADVEAPLRALAPALGDADVLLLMRLALRCRYNCFYAGFYRTCALINHSCRPNVAMKSAAAQRSTAQQQLGGGGSISLLAVADVAAGAEINVKYLDDFHFMMGVLFRRAALQQSWLFICDCPRCTEDLDPGNAEEWLRCDFVDGGGEQCGGFVHLPFAPNMDIEGAVAERVCGKCGKPNSFTAEKKAKIGTIVVRINNLFGNMGQIDLPGVHKTCVELRQHLAREAHLAHWLHRLVLYTFCMTALQAPSNHWLALDRAAPAERPALLAKADAALGLANFRLQRGARGDYVPNPTEALDVLGWFVELWSRMRSFYPPGEAWMVHVLISKMVAMRLMLTGDDAGTPDLIDLLAEYATGTSTEVCQQLYKMLRVSSRLSDASLKLVYSAFFDA